MKDKYQWARDEITLTLDSYPFITPWTFEYTPGSSETIDNGCLRHVRESDFVFWLITSEISPIVFSLPLNRQTLVWRWIGFVLFIGAK
jgi:hypothetical protein